MCKIKKNLKLLIICNKFPYYLATFKNLQTSKNLRSYQQNVNVLYRKSWENKELLTKWIEWHRTSIINHAQLLRRSSMLPIQFHPSTIAVRKYTFLFEWNFLMTSCWVKKKFRSDRKRISGFVYPDTLRCDVLKKLIARLLLDISRGNIFPNLPFAYRWKIATLI